MIKTPLYACIIAGIASISAITSYAAPYYSDTIAKTSTFTSAHCICTPESGSEVAQFDGLTLLFNDASSVSIDEEKEIFVMMNGEDITANIALDPVATRANRMVFIYSRTATTPLSSRGTLSFSFPEGYFLLDGTTPSEALSVSLTLNPSLNAGVSITSYLSGSTLPVTNLPFILSNSDLAGRFADGEMLIGLSSDTSTDIPSLAINTACASPLTMRRNGDIIATIPATPSVSDTPTPSCSIIDSEWCGGKGIQIQLAQQISEEGLYTLTIPRGYFKLAADGTPLAGTTLKFSVGLGTFAPAHLSEVNLTAPSSGVAVKDGALQNIFLECYNSECVLNSDFYGSDELIHDTPILTGCSEKATLTRREADRDIQVASFQLGTQQVGMNQGRVLFSLNMLGNTPLTEDGTYTLHIPAGFFRVHHRPLAQIQSPEDVTLVNTPFEMQFTLTGGVNPDIVYTLTSPSPGAYNPFPTVRITYPKAQSISVPEGCRAALYFNSMATVPEHYLDVSAEGNVLIITPSAPITTPAASEYAQYRLEIPAGSFEITAQGRTYPNTLVKVTDIRMKAVESGLPTPLIAVNPEALTTDLMEFDMEFDTPLTRINTIASVALFRRGDTGNFARVNTYALTLAEDKRSIHCILKGSVRQNPTNTLTTLPEGDYELRIPSGTYYVTIDGTQKGNTLLTYPFTINTNTGVATLPAEDDAHTPVYTIDGIRIHTRPLPPGLYIISGKLRIMN